VGVKIAAPARGGRASTWSPVAIHVVTLGQVYHSVTRRASRNLIELWRYGYVAVYMRPVGTPFTLQLPGSAQSSPLSGAEA
jgi:hypothetical protein